MRLETERLVLRNPGLEDAEAALEYLTDPEVMRFLGGVEPDGDARAVIERWLARWDANGFGHVVIERREDGRFLGRIGMIVWDTRTWRQLTDAADAGAHAQPELGWTLARAHWGRGYATEAARAVRDWARSELGLERLVSLIAPENVRSQHVAARLGAKPTETVTLFDGSPAVIWVHPASGYDRGGQAPAR